MSYEVFPALPGVDIKVRRSLIPPKVQVFTTPSEREYRGRSATVPRYEYELTFNVLRSGAEAELQQVVGFFLRHGGAFDSFLFEDEHDNTATDAQIGVGDGTTTSWQMLRSFGGFSEPVTAPKLFPAVKVNGAAVNLVPNGSFEANPLTALATGWSSYAIGSLGTVTHSQTAWAVDGAVGQFSGCTAMASGAGNALGVYRQDLVGPFSGQTFTLGASFLVTSGRRINLYVDWFNSAGTFIDGAVEQYISTGIAVRLWFTRTAPVGAARATIYLYADQGAGGAVEVRVDGVQMQVGSGPESYSPNVLTLGADGRLSFASPVPAGHAITWSGQFYRRVRFQAEQADFERFLKELWSWRQVRLLSVKA